MESLSLFRMTLLQFKQWDSLRHPKKLELIEAPVRMDASKVLSLTPAYSKVYYEIKPSYSRAFTTQVLKLFKDQRIFSIRRDPEGPPRATPSSVENT